MAERLDLVCGPADPLPEATKSFQLIERLGSGGQADVYKAVRRSGGVSSAPVTMKVFRPQPDRPLEAQYRSWDKGDAVHMDLDTRGITGICRRIDAFYGPPPHRPDAAPGTNLVPYQVLEYLPGRDLKLMIRNRPVQRIDAVSVLRTIAGVLDAMHRPNSPEIHPALHMDIKPSNVVILPSGEARVIDFTGARYALPTHLTTISYTPQSAGPEALEGRVGPSYDVHGFGSVAFYLVTGGKPRVEGVGSLHGDPLLEANPRLRDHLLAPLADNPRDRPPTSHLDHWITELARLMRDAETPDLGVDWGREAPFSTTKLPQPNGHEEPATKPDLAAVTAEASSTRRMGGADTDTPRTRRIGDDGHDAPRTRRMGERDTAPVTAATGTATVMATASVPTSAPPANRYGRGVAVPAQPRREAATAETPVDPEITAQPAEPSRPWTGPGGKLSALTGGAEFTVVGVLFAFVCWGMWVIDNIRSSVVAHILYFVVVLAVATAVFFIARLVGTIVLVRLLHRTRRTARLSHLASAAFLIITGIGFLSNVSFINNAINWLSNMV